MRYNYLSLRKWKSQKYVKKAENDVFENIWAVPKLILFNTHSIKRINKKEFGEMKIWIVWFSCRKKKTYSEQTVLT